MLYKTTDPSAFQSHAATSISAFLNSVLAEKSLANVALSGGKSPVPVYQALALSPVAWSRVNLFLADERYAPLNSEESNHRMVQENLVNRVKQVKNFYHYNTRKPIKGIVSQYQALLEARERPLFDLVVLGLGEDGHTASLFPHGSALHEKNRLVMHTQKPDSVHPQDRMTLTFPAILSSRKIIFLIQGKSKSAVLDRWLNASPPPTDELPATGILAHPDVEIFYLMN